MSGFKLVQTFQPQLQLTEVAPCEPTTGNIWEGVEIISQYTRAQAIEDGELVDVTETAREAGFCYPVALTRSVWDGFVVPDPRSVPFGQSIEGRLWDVVSMCRFAIMGAKAQGIKSDRFYFRLTFVMKKSQRRLVTLKAVCAPGDTAEPTVTIMQPEED